MRVTAQRASESPGPQGQPVPSAAAPTAPEVEPRPRLSEQMEPHLTGLSSGAAEVLERVHR
eukprot:scaffold621524_cov25-Prasinocladus_malaysianus.AAC.1